MYYLTLPLTRIRKVLRTYDFDLPRGKVVLKIACKNIGRVLTREKENIVYPSPTNVSAYKFADICCPLPSGEVVGRSGETQQNARKLLLPLGEDVRRTDEG